MKQIVKAENRISQFMALLESGSKNWLDAGKLLCEMVDDDPNVYEKIIKLNPTVKLAALETLEHIGRHQIEPALLLDNKPAIRKALELSGDTAKELFSSGVQVVKIGDGGTRIERKPLENLTHAETHQVFFQNGVRTPENQTLFIREQEAKKIVAEKMRYIMDGDRVTFLENCTFSAGELMELANRLAEKSKATLAEEMNRKQIAK